MSYASWGRRMAAAIVDGLIYLVLAVGGTAAGPWVAAALTVDRTVESGPSPIGSAAQVLLFLAAIGAGPYDRWLRSGLTGRTWGRALLRIRLVGTTTGAPIGVFRAVVRDVAHLVDSLLLYLGWLLPLVDRQRQTIADKIVGTVVVRSAGEGAPGEAPSRGRPAVAALMVVLVVAVALGGVYVASPYIDRLRNAAAAAEVDDCLTAPDRGSGRIVSCQEDAAYYRVVARGAAGEDPDRRCAGTRAFTTLQVGGGLLSRSPEVMLCLGLAHDRGTVWGQPLGEPGDCLAQHPDPLVQRVLVECDDARAGWEVVETVDEVAPDLAFDQLFDAYCAGAGATGFLSWPDEPPFVWLTCVRSVDR